MNDEWQIIHDFRRAVRRGRANPIVCPEDNIELVPVIDTLDGVALRCISCKAVYHIGLDMWDQMKAVV